MTAPALQAYVQGQGTVSADNLNTFIQTATNATMLRLLTGLPGMIVLLQGIAVENDGDGGLFYWNALGTHADDNFNYIVPEGTGTGEWERLSVLSTLAGAIFTTLYVSGLSTLHGDTIIGGVLSESLVTGLSGAGTTQGTATPLTANINIATTVGSGTGFILPLVTPNGNLIQPGTEIKLYNRGANIASLYPPTGDQIETLGTNNPSGVSPGGAAIATFAGSNQWWIM